MQGNIIHNPSFFSAVIIVISVGWVFDLRATNDRFPSLPNRRRTRNSPGEKAKEKKKKHSVCCLSGRLVLSTTYRWPISLGGYSFFPDSERGEIFEFLHLYLSVFEWQKIPRNHPCGNGNMRGKEGVTEYGKEEGEEENSFLCFLRSFSSSSFLPFFPSCDISFTFACAVKRIFFDDSTFDKY